MGLPPMQFAHSLHADSPYGSYNIFMVMYSIFIPHDKAMREDKGMREAIRASYKAGFEPALDEVGSAAAGVGHARAV